MKANLIDYIPAMIACLSFIIIIAIFTINEVSKKRSSKKSHEN